MRKERALIRSLTALSPSSPDARFALSPTDAIALLTHRAVAAAHAQSSQGGAVTEGLFDASDRREGGGVVVWWNDLERDSRCVPRVLVPLCANGTQLIYGAQIRTMGFLPQPRTSLPSPS